ncbi:unnamed protein product, partial [Adineta ricciae]
LAESSVLRWIHVLLWSWLNPILTIGYKRQITDDDLFEVSLNDECSQLLAKFEGVWEQHEKQYEYVSTWKTIIQTFWKPILIAGLIYIPYIGVKIAQPLLLRQLVNTISDKTVPSYIGYLYAIGLALSTLLQALLHQQFFFRSSRVGLHARVVLSSIIYKKMLSLPTRAIMKTNTGQIVNLISNDASTFEEFSFLIHHIWGAPLEAIIVFILIWSQIGIATLFGCGVLLLLVPLQTFISRKSGKYRKETVAWADKRVKIINEILVGCQIVKMYRWEEALENVVYDTRKNELKIIRKASQLRAVNMGIFFASLPLIALATFGGNWLMDQPLSAANIFSILSLYNNLRLPLTNVLPLAIGKLIESQIASKRINQFMNLSKQTCTTTLEKENILFCKPFHKEKYEEVIKSCQLISDLRSFRSGDLTIIGEKGVNLSGGQKARISLARALYTDADIYLFDDPLAAVDPSVAKKIFQHCIGNESIVKKKTRLLVTHQIQFLAEFDHCILLDRGNIEKQGLFNDLLSVTQIRQLYEQHQHHSNETNESKERHNSIDSNYDSANQFTTTDETSILKDEISTNGTVNINVWLKLFTSEYGCFVLVLLIFLMLIGQGIYDATNKWLSIWSSEITTEKRKTYYLYIYLGLIIGTMIIGLIRASYFFHSLD